MGINKFLIKGQSLIGIIIVLVIVSIITGGLYFYLSAKFAIPEEVVAPEDEIAQDEVAPEEVKEPVAPRAILVGDDTLMGFLPMEVTLGYKAVFDVFYKKGADLTGPIGTVNWERVEKGKTRKTVSYKIPEKARIQAEVESKGMYVIKHDHFLRIQEIKAEEEGITTHIIIDHEKNEMEKIIIWGEGEINTKARIDPKVLQKIDLDILEPGWKREFNLLLELIGTEAPPGWDIVPPPPATVIEATERKNVVIPIGNFEALMIQYTGGLLFENAKNVYYVTPQKELIKIKEFLYEWKGLDKIEEAFLVLRLRDYSLVK